MWSIASRRVGIPFLSILVDEFAKAVRKSSRQRVQGDDIISYTRMQHQAIYGSFSRKTDIHIKPIGILVI
jgi:hypothetical protein